MSIEPVYVVVPLANDANDEWTNVGPNFALRAKQAVHEYYALWKQDVVVLIAQGAGAPANRFRDVTLATLGQKYIQRYWMVPVAICNADEYDVYGTLAEMRWVVAAVQAKYPRRKICFTFVTQPRHLRRVKIIARYFLPQENCLYRFVSSEQSKEIPLYHEVRSYIGLGLTMCGLGGLVRFIRKRLLLGIDRAR